MKVGNRGLMFLIVYLAATTVSLSQLKVIPVLGTVAQEMGISVSATSWLMSVFTVAGIILAIPGAAILQKTGPKKLFMLLMVALVVGNLLGAVSTTYPLLLASRMIEGIAFAMVIMVGMVLLGMWYPGNSLVIGIYTTFASVGNVIVMNAEMPIIGALGSIKSIWYVVAALAAIFLVLLGLVVKEVAPEDPAGPGGEAPKVSMGDAFKSKPLLLLALAQLCVGFVLFTFMTIYPSIFTEVYGLDVTKANFYAGLFGLFSIPFCILGGAIIDKVGKASMVALVAFIGMAVVSFATIAMGAGGNVLIVIHTLLMACGTGLALTAILSTAPTTVAPVIAGVAVAIVNMLYYLGIFIGTPITMNVAAKSGWGAGTSVIGVVAALGAVIILVYNAISRKNNDVS